MIHWLAANGRTEILGDVYRLIGNIDIEDAQGQTALHVASQNGHLSMVQSLLDYKADINRQTNFGWTPLHFACSHGQHETAKCLLDRGAVISDGENPHPTTPNRSPNLTPDSPSLTAESRRASEARGHMLTKTPLVLCFEGGYSETCDLLLQYWPNVYQHFYSILTSSNIPENKVLKVLTYLCVHHGNQMTVKLLSNISQSALHFGHSVLSISTDTKSEESNLLRCVQVMSMLQAAVSSTPSAINGKQLEKVFEPLNQLWELLRNWMLMLEVDFKNEAERIDGTCDNVERTQSLPPTKIHEDKETEGSKVTSNRDKDSGASLRHALSKAAENSRDVLEVMPPRLCAVIHAFYVVCSSSTQKGDSVSTVFEEFVNKNGHVLTSLVQRDPTVIFDHFHFLLDIPQLFSHFIPIIRKQPFEARRQWFYENLKKEQEMESAARGDNSNSSSPDEDDLLIVQRDSLFQSSCDQVLQMNPDRLKRNFNLRFQGEEGMGQGVVREWFNVLSKEILNPDYALFTQSADGCTFQPNSQSAVNPDHLNYFRFAGQCLGLALYHQQLINAYFTRSFYKHILGVPVNYTDVASIDPEYAKNLQWILDHEICDLGLDLTFSVETDVFGVMEEMELKHGGRGIPVTDNNKTEYVQLVTELRMTRGIQPQIDSFLEGFNLYIPQKLVRLFDEYELELLLSGIPEIDMADWKANTTYVDCDIDTPVVQWFWESMAEFSEQERVLMLQFVTGSSRLPFGGFSKLAGGGGPQKFSISLVPYTHDLLPSASTCINFFRLPNYPTKDLTREKLSVALQCGSQGYALA
ncbi:E3 ubiquitin-protein ligase HACE1-like isoform X2 [Mya arenaria]|nr:E3 ubiquitin-protein ligase HACE1-like isoform X2 [Mya arenaria]